MLLRMLSNNLVTAGMTAKATAVAVKMARFSFFSSLFSARAKHTQAARANTPIEGQRS